MKKIYLPVIAALTGVSMTLTGCIEETFPTTTVTQGQIQNSPTAAASYALGMPAFLNSVGILPGSFRHFDWGYGSQMRIRDFMTGDFATLDDYGWYAAWRENKNMSGNYIYSQLMWYFYTQFNQTANLTIGAVNPESASDQNLYYLGCAYAMRALAYIDMAGLYEYLPTDGTEGKSPEGNDVVGLTVPIVTESMGEAEARNNPRAPHAEMMDFIISDLDNAEQYIVKGKRSSKSMPDLAVVYGLKARAYMWDQNYPKAAEYARKAINEHAGTPMTKEQWLDAKTAFNTDVPSWMLSETLVQEDGQVQTGIINFVSWNSNEYKAGYAAAGCYSIIDKNLYDQISDDDFRKLTFVAPEGSPLAGKENFIDRVGLETETSADNPAVVLPAYASLKFKPGTGDMYGSMEAVTTAWPIMRVEEMYFIEAEATAHTNAAQGKALIERFMKDNRYSTYTCSASSTDAVVDEIFLQKRMEFFGEGIIFFDYKRLNKPVTRHYEGTNWAPNVQFNTTTRPAWMNLVFIDFEGEGNKGLDGWNNPDPSDCYPNLGNE